MAPETKTEKAERLIRDGKVTPIVESTDGVGVYAVRGDTKPYLVLVMEADQRGKAVDLGVAPGSCPCEAREGCSHLLAATAMFRTFRNRHTVEEQRARG